MKWRTDLESMPLSTLHQKRPKCRKIERRIPNSLKIYDANSNNTDENIFVLKENEKFKEKTTIYTVHNDIEMIKKETNQHRHSIFFYLSFVHFFHHLPSKQQTEK